jgi:hypothetical protein
VYHGPNYGYVINVLNAPLILGANNAANVAILPSGNVGINKAAPAYALDVTGDCNISGTYRVNGVALSTGGAPGAWSAYTPTVTDNVGTAMATSALTAHYVVFGSILFIQIVFVVTMTANSGAINFTLPTTVVADSNNVTCYAAWGSGTQNQAVIASGSSGTSIKITMGSFSNGSSLQLYIGGSLRIS